jgi:toxin YhaV
MPLTRSGWRIYAHPCFTEQYRRLVEAAERARARDPEGFRASAPCKMLRMVHEIITRVLASEAGSPAHRQGATLGGRRKHWFRVKFGGRFRLFYRYSRAERIIILAWINDEDTKRKAGARSDPYAVFGRMLDRGSPPDSWPDLLREAGEQNGGFDAVAARGDRTLS